MKRFLRALRLALMLSVCAPPMAQAQGAEPAPVGASSPVAVSGPAPSAAAEPALPASAPARSIALAHIFPSQTYSAQNGAARTGFGMMFGLVGAMASLGVERERRAHIKVLIEMELNLHQELMDALKAEFKNSNQELFDLESPKYYPGEPENLDITASKSKSDWIMTANIFDVGVSNNFSANKFVPRLNVSFYVTNRHTEESVYDTSIYYGADARKSTPDQIPVDPNQGFENFNDILGARKKEYVQALRSGVSAIAKTVALQVGQLKLDVNKP